MTVMNNLTMKKIIPAIGLLLLIAAGCKDYNDLDTEELNSGDADFSTYVAVGNSLTAGFQNGALYRDAQEFSFPRLLARQFRQVGNFEQPLVTNPGLGFVDGKPVGRIELTSLSPLQTHRNPNNGTQIFEESDKPFENMGVPGSILVDYLNPGNQGMLKERSTNPQHPKFNPFYSFVLPNSELAKDAPNIHNQVAAQNPTFITFWLGNNDVLGFVKSGGEGQAITDPTTFQNLYQGSVQALASTGAGVVAYNIPDVTSIPFVFLLRSQLQQQGAIVFNADTQSYQLVTQNGNFDIYIQVDDTTNVMRRDDFLLLTASSYFTKVQEGEINPPIQPETAIPDKYVLDGKLGDADPANSELEQAAGAVAQYNGIISSAVSSAGFALVDINGIYDDVLSNYQSNGGGYPADDLTLRPLPGSLFSFDGIHPTNRGAAVIANETIKVINNFYGANVEQIDITDIPEGIPVQ